MHKFKNRFPYDEEEYAILIFCFEAILKRFFLEHLQRMSEEIGYSYNSSWGYGFPNGFESPDDEDYFENGVEFVINESRTIIANEFFYECLKLACDIYLEENPDDRNFVNEKLAVVKNRYNIAEK